MKTGKQLAKEALKDKNKKALRKLLGRVCACVYRGEGEGEGRGRRKQKQIPLPPPPTHTSKKRSNKASTQNEQISSDSSTERSMKAEGRKAHTRTHKTPHKTGGNGRRAEGVRVGGGEGPG
jgi:hypothetical protein